MPATLQKYVDHFIGRHREVAERTAAELGEDRALQFVSLQSDWVVLIGAIIKAYPELTAPPSGELPEAAGSLVLIDLQGLLLELDRQQFAFLGGHYAAIGRSQRYVWELMYRALWADTYAEAFPGKGHPPGPTPDDKAKWLKKRERKMDWRSVVQPLLRRLLPSVDIRQFAKVWTKLNHVVHPSWELRDRLINPTGLLVADNFDADWAAEVLSDAATVFDLIWLAVLHRFPDCRRLLANETTFTHCPLSRAAVRV
jgi:hypothetical protein